MPKRTSTRKDLNTTAFSVVQQAIGETEKNQPKVSKGKNPAAVALGRLGGLKGGVARAKKLSKKRRAEIARNAAKTRWNPEPE